MIIEGFRESSTALRNLRALFGDVSAAADVGSISEKLTADGRTLRILVTSPPAQGTETIVLEVGVHKSWGLKDATFDLKEEDLHSHFDYFSGEQELQVAGDLTARGRLKMAGTFFVVQDAFGA